MSLASLVKKVAAAGAEEVRLLPGRQIVIVRGGVASEAGGDKQTADSVKKLLEPVMSKAVRQKLASGSAEWTGQLSGVGAVALRATVSGGVPHVVIRVGGQEEPVEVEPDSVDLDLPSQFPGGGPPSAPSGASPPAVPVEIVGAPPPPSAAAAPSSPAVVTKPAEPRGSTKAMDGLLSATIEMGGSDLHLCSDVQPIARVDGSMKPIKGTRALASADVKQILWPIVPDRIRREFEERNDADFAYMLPGRARFRGNLFMDRNGIGAVFRVIPTEILDVETLGLPTETLRLCALPKGLVLVTGPTGSGKSTTLAALVDYINKTRSAHIVTIEDPIEFVFENKKCLINQRQLGEHTNSFKDALRAALREDPDIVLVGEMRDLETIEIALETAETGHLVFGTLHTTSAPATVDRIIDQFPADRQNQIRTMLSESLKGVIAQMLCKKQGGGRVAAYEILFGLPAVANLIREKKVFQLPSVMQTGRKIGMRLMNDSFVELVKKGTVTPQEALAKAIDRTGLASALKQANIKV